MLGIRAIQKQKTRQALVAAAFNQLSSERSFSSLAQFAISAEDEQE